MKIKTKSTAMEQVRLHKFSNYKNFYIFFCFSKFYFFMTTENLGYLTVSNYCTKQGKAITAEAWTGPEGSRRLRHADF